MPLVLLDRDGVINEDSNVSIKHPSEWKPIPGSLWTIARLNRTGFSVAVCTNQAGVGRGIFAKDDLDATHQTMQAALAREGGHIDAIFCCTHAPNARCACRKPKPGLLGRAMGVLNASPKDTTFVGDSLRDTQAAIAARCTPGTSADRKRHELRIGRTRQWCHARIRRSCVRGGLAH